MVQTQVTAQGWLGSTPEGRHPRSEAGALLARRLSPARQVLHIPHIVSPGFLVSMSIHARTALRRWGARGLASHTELPKMVSTTPTYIVYDKIAGILRASRNRARLAAKKRLSNRPAASFCNRACQFSALLPSRSKTPASSPEITALPSRNNRPVYSTRSR